MLIKSVKIVRIVLVVSLLPVLLACSILGVVPGVSAGILVSSATANPAFGVAVATMTNAVVDSGIKYIMKRFSAAEQQQIANAIGQTEPGQERQWEVRQPIPYGNNHGRVVVISASQNALTSCKEALFSVVNKKDNQDVEQWYTLSVCFKGNNNWMWSQSEPAVKRWGALQ